VSISSETMSTDSKEEEQKSTQTPVTVPFVTPPAAGSTTQPPPPPPPGGATPGTFTPDSLGPASLQVLNDFSFQLTSASVATREQVSAVFNKWLALGIPQTSLFPAALTLTMAAFHNSASELENFSGAFLNISLDDLAGCVRSCCTLRQFCAFYAKFAWNLAIKQNVPPAGAAKRKFPADCLFAGFDFFHGVLSPAALEPPAGLTRKPSERERLASSAAEHLQLRAASGPGFASLRPEVTHGRFDDSDDEPYFMP